jgi:hypothetical protein
MVPSTVGLFPKKRMNICCNALVHSFIHCGIDVGRIQCGTALIDLLSFSIFSGIKYYCNAVLTFIHCGIDVGYSQCGTALLDLLLGLL